MMRLRNADCRNAYYRNADYRYRNGYYCNADCFILDILVPESPFLHNIKCERECKAK
jgi:hypothetical protein